jgi:hypothetical protein
MYNQFEFELELTMLKFNFLVVFLLQIYIKPAAVAVTQNVVFSVNCGGDVHLDDNRIYYAKDTAVKGKTIIWDIARIAGVSQNDETLYKTIRYDTIAFGYDVSVAGDGQYVLTLKFSEGNQHVSEGGRVFHVLINDQHVVLSKLDIYKAIGLGIARDELIHFSVCGTNLQYKNQMSTITGNKVRVEILPIVSNAVISGMVLIKKDEDSQNTITGSNSSASNGFERAHKLQCEKLKEVEQAVVIKTDQELEKFINTDNKDSKKKSFLHALFQNNNISSFGVTINNYNYGNNGNESKTTILVNESEL